MSVFLRSIKEINMSISTGTSKLFEKFLLRKTEVPKTSIFKIQKVHLKVSFWRAPNHPDITESLKLKVSCSNLKIRRQVSKSVRGFSNTLILEKIVTF